MVIAEIDPETGSQTRKEVEGIGRKAIFIRVDVANQKAVQSLVDQVLRIWNRIDILVNNAGFDRGATLFKVKEEDWDAVLDVHLKGTLNLYPSYCFPYDRKPLWQDRQHLLHLGKNWSRSRNQL